jgi:hypothetical protein
VRELPGANSKKTLGENVVSHLVYSLDQVCNHMEKNEMNLQRASAANAAMMNLRADSPVIKRACIALIASVVITITMNGGSEHSMSVGGASGFIPSVSPATTRVRVASWPPEEWAPKMVRRGVDNFSEVSARIGYRHLLIHCSNELSS